MSKFLTKTSDGDEWLEIAASFVGTLDCCHITVESRYANFGSKATPPFGSFSFWNYLDFLDFVWPNFFQYFFAIIVEMWMHFDSIRYEIKFIKSKIIKEIVNLSDFILVFPSISSSFYLQITWNQFHDKLFFSDVAISCLFAELLCQKGATAFSINHSFYCPSSKLAHISSLRFISLNGMKRKSSKIIWENMEICWGAKW